MGDNEDRHVEWLEDLAAKLGADLQATESVLAAARMAILTGGDLADVAAALGVSIPPDVGPEAPQ